MYIKLEAGASLGHQACSSTSVLEWEPQQALWGGPVTLDMITKCALARFTLNRLRRTLELAILFAWAACMCCLHFQVNTCSLHSSLHSVLYLNITWSWPIRCVCHAAFRMCACRNAHTVRACSTRGEDRSTTRVESISTASSRCFERQPPAGDRAHNGQHLPQQCASFRTHIKWA